MECRPSGLLSRQPRHQNSHESTEPPNHETAEHAEHADEKFSAPTPLIYNGLVYVLGNNGVFDPYDLRTGDEVYRQRLPHVGNGFSASPVGADGKIYLSSEDGEIVVVAAGRTFRHIATNSMGDLLMATPALSGGVMYVRTATTLFAIGRSR